MNGIDEKLVRKIPGAPVVLASAEWAINAGRSNSIWTLTFGLRCCAMEMMATGAAKYDWARFGFEVPAASPRRADLMIVAGTITTKMAPLVCAISGGPFIYDSYSVVRGADKVIPVDIYIPGCPPRPEALLDGMIKLQEKIMKQKLTKAAS